MVSTRRSASHDVRRNAPNANPPPPNPPTIEQSMMAPFEALYGRKCRTPLFWNQTGESQVFGPKILKDVERQVQTIQENLRVAQSRQKSYADTF